MAPAPGNLSDPERPQEPADGPSLDHRGESTSSPEPDPVTALVHAAVPAVARLGIVVELLRPGAVGLRVPLAPNANHVGTMYAGALFALAELPGGLLPLSVPELGVTPIVTHAEVDFLRAARTDIRLDAHMPEAELRRLADVAHDVGSASFELSTEALDSEGSVVMSCQARYLLRSNLS